MDELKIEQLNEAVNLSMGMVRDGVLIGKKELGKEILDIINTSGNEIPIHTLNKIIDLINTL